MSGGIAYLVDKDADTGFKVGNAWGWTRIGYGRFATPDKEDVRVIARFAHLITIPGGTKIYRGPKFKENKDLADFDRAVYTDKIAFYAETPDDVARAAAKKETV